MALLKRKWPVIICLLLVALAVGYINLNGQNLADWRRDTMGGATPDLSSLQGKEAMFYEQLEDDRVQCNLCFRNCVIPEGERGFCRNRENREGTLYNLVYAQASAVHVDPVEKEPMHHFLPGNNILCIGTASCNFRCKFCHNWHMSQRSIEEIGYAQNLSPREVVQEAVNKNIPAISFTYNEPTVFYEYMYDIAKRAQERGIKVIFHTNGSMNPEPLRKLLPYIDGVTVDLKGFDNQYYEDITKGELETVLETLKIIREKGVWLEIVNLVLPDLNEDSETIREMSEWINEELGPGTPVHFSRFMPSYQMQDLSPTPVETLEEAADTAQEAGLKYISIGNVPGHRKNSTFCGNCDNKIISRHHFSVYDINVDDEGNCEFCGESIPGVWE